MELEETLVGYGSVAVPVLGSAGEVYAAISATLPVNRLYVTRLAPQLHATAVGITRAVERRTGRI